MSIKENSVSAMGHPCRGCPYVFSGTERGCIMAAVPGDCAWYFYKRMMGHTDAFVPSEKIRKQYRDRLPMRSETEAKLERGIEMLFEAAELKYGRRYAQHLKKKMSRDGR